mmetsp:Transcript_13181/g.27235  ORF Transcript_13181/g.27235 Transcript_13181/m.27235 type:complete len:81 (+) Transcript_13181:100-342(+)
MFMLGAATTAATATTGQAAPKTKIACGRSAMMKAQALFAQQIRMKNEKILVAVGYSDVNWPSPVVLCLLHAAMTPPKTVN